MTYKSITTTSFNNNKSIAQVKPHSKISRMSSDQVTPTTTRHNLLTLPREIRDEIYLTVLQSPSEPPRCPEYAGSRFAGFGSEPEQQKIVFYPTNVYPRYACQSLQACNHQVNIEVREVLARHDSSKQGLDFKLDLMIQDCRIWPTWTLLPGPITHIRNLEVEMRMFDGCHGSQFGGDGGPGAIFRPLFHLLSGLFHHGPQFIYKGPFQRQLRVDTMIFTICRRGVLEGQPHDERDARGLYSVLSISNRISQSVWLKLRMIASCGTLLGRVSKLKLNTGEDVKEFPVPNRKMAQGMVDHWDSYGYHWGIETPSEEDILRSEESLY
ncbi:MAG: hypothetical protein Q9175_007068 [Cornicularia normoerica]